MVAPLAVLCAWRVASAWRGGMPRCYEPEPGTPGMIGGLGGPLLLPTPEAPLLIVLLVPAIPLLMLLLPPPATPLLMVLLPPPAKPLLMPPIPDAPLAPTAAVPIPLPVPALGTGSGSVGPVVSSGQPTSPRRSRGTHVHL
jgi:hypothetical protein